LRQDHWKRLQALEQQQRELAEKTLALEEYQQAFILRSADAATADSRLTHFRKQLAQQSANEGRKIAGQFERLEAEAAKVQRRGQELLQIAEALENRDANLAQRQIAWEESLTAAQSEQGDLRQRLETAELQRKRLNGHITELQGEIERLAKLLIE